MTLTQTLTYVIKDTRVSEKGSERTSEQFLRQCI